MSEFAEGTIKKLILSFAHVMSGLKRQLSESHAAASKTATEAEVVKASLW